MSRSVQSFYFYILQNVSRKIWSFIQTQRWGSLSYLPTACCACHRLCLCGFSLCCVLFKSNEGWICSDLRKKKSEIKACCPLQVGKIKSPKDKWQPSVWWKYLLNNVQPQCQSARKHLLFQNFRRCTAHRASFTSSFLWSCHKTRREN